jgi:uridylate kinase
MLPKYKRILLKLSGESLMGNKNFGMDSDVIAQYAMDIKSIIELGVQVAVVIGGGNIYRGLNEAESGIERAHGDYMGMLATVINGMALQAGLEKVGGVYTVAKCHKDGADRRTLYSSQGNSTPGKGSGSDLRCWNG